MRLLGLVAQEVDVGEVQEGRDDAPALRAVPLLFDFERAPQVRLALFELPGVHANEAELRVHVGGEVRLGGAALLGDVEGAREVRPGLLVEPLLPVDVAEVRERVGHFQVFAPERLLAQLDHALRDGQGLFVLALVEESDDLGVQAVGLRGLVLARAPRRGRARDGERQDD